MNKPITRRMSHEDRLKFLIDCTFKCVAEKGLDGTTIREVAARAEVTYGLIRHYFPNKDALIEATYQSVTQEMTQLATAAAHNAGPLYKNQLLAFVTATLSDPFVSRDHLSFWSCFVNRNIVDDKLEPIKKDGYAVYRQELKNLIRNLYAEENIQIDEKKLHQKMIQLNSIVDGLWIEACLSLEELSENELLEIGIESAEAILGCKLRN